MTKADFIQAVQIEMGDSTPKSTIKKVLDAAGAVRMEMLKEGKGALLDGLGSLKVVQRAGRTGRDPRTGKPIEIPARNAAKYTPSKAVKDLFR